MPLSELPANHIGTNRQLAQTSAVQRHGKPSAGTPILDENSDILRNPSSIQSMLKNTTETGNVGQFSIKPSRVPAQAPRSPQFRSNNHSPSGAYYNTHHHSNGPSIPIPSCQGSTQRQNQKSTQGPSRAPSIEEYRSYSMTQSSYASHSLTHRRPYASSNHHAYEDLRNLRPRSPFAYPTRLKRPGYRPSSPAFSDFNRFTPSSGGGDYGDTHFRTTSPSSLYATDGSPSPWQQPMNRSDPMLRYYPSYSNIGPARTQSPSVSSTRPSTPRISASFNSTSTISRSVRNQPNNNGHWTKAQLSPKSPVFYDYTEAFEEEDIVLGTNSATKSTATFAEQARTETITETYFEPNGTLENPNPAELPAEVTPSETLSRTTADARPQSLVHGNHNDNISVSVHEKESGSELVPSCAEKCSSSSENGVTSLIRISSIDKENPPSSSFEEGSGANAVVKENLLPSENDASQQLSPGNSGRPNTLKATGSNDQDSSLDSVKCPSVSDHMILGGTNTYGLDKDAASLAQSDSPEIDLQRTQPTIDEHSINISQSMRATLQESHSEIENTEILSPTPDRSLISPSQRDRFSKIFSIGEGLPELHEPLASSQGESSIQRLSAEDRSHRSIDSSDNYRGHKPAAHFGNSSTKLRTAAGYQMTENSSDSEDEPELSLGFRETFCKPDQNSPEVRRQSTPIVLKSTLVQSRSQLPLSVRRSPAMRKPVTSISRRLDTTPSKACAHGDNLLLERNDSQVKGSTIEHKQPSFVNKNLPESSQLGPAISAFAPPEDPSPSGLPFSFIPILRRRSDETLAEMDAAAVLPEENEKKQEGRDIEVPRFKLKSPSNGSSISSRPNSRPWNLDSNYPWSEQTAKLSVGMPESTEDNQSSTERHPRFKLRIHRASSSTDGTSRLARQGVFSEAPRSRLPSTSDLLQSAIHRRRPKPELPVFPGQINSSHDSVQSSPMQTRFVESFEYPSVASPDSPRITLMPPSPHEVRSFFSDDSSQIRPRGSLRKRFSQFRAKNRTSSTDEGRGYDRGLLMSALGWSGTTGRSSRQSQTTAGGVSHTSQIRQVRSKVVEKFRHWWYRGEDKIKDWGLRMRSRGKNRSIGAGIPAAMRP